MSFAGGAGTGICAAARQEAQVRAEDVTLGFPVPSLAAIHLLVLAVAASRPPRSPSLGAIFRGYAMNLLVPAPRRPVPGLPMGLLLAVALTPCVAAAVARFACRC